MSKSLPVPFSSLGNIFKNLLPPNFSTVCAQIDNTNKINIHSIHLELDIFRASAFSMMSFRDFYSSKTREPGY